MAKSTSKLTHVVFVSGLASLANAFQEIWSDENFLSQLLSRSHFHRGENGTGNQIQFHFTKPGLLSSYHDQACEIFAQIRGGKVDFGEEHATECCHARYGRDFGTSGPLVADWSATLPVHFVCHSTAANVVRKLHTLLSRDFWQCGSSGDWIRCIIFLSPNFNGTPLTNLFGIPTHVGSHTKEKYMELMEKLLFSFHWFEKRIKNQKPRLCENLWQWYLQHWDLGAYHADSWMQQVRQSHFLLNNDHIFYDVTMHGCEEINKWILSAEHPLSQTYLLSIYTKITNKQKAILIRPSINPILIMSAGHMLCLKPTDLSLNHENPNFSVDWVENDGLLPVAAQRYPLFTLSFSSDSESQLTFSECPLPQPLIDWCRSVILPTPCSLQEATPQPDPSCIHPNMFYHINVKNLLNSKRSWDHLDCLWGRDFLKPQIFQLTPEAHVQLYTAVLSLLRMFSHTAEAHAEACQS